MTFFGYNFGDLAQPRWARNKAIHIAYYYLITKLYRHNRNQNIENNLSDMGIWWGLNYIFVVKWFLNVFFLSYHIILVNNQ